MHERNGSIEWLRVLAALGIVGFHAQDGLISEVGYAGLPVFVVLSFFLLGDVCDSAGFASQSWDRFARRRAHRLLLPWVAWVAIYLVLDLALAFLGLQGHREQVLSSFNPFYGTRIHLWYMPFVFLGMLFIRLAAPFCIRIGSRGLVVLSLVIAVLGSLLLPEIFDPEQLPRPIPQFLQAIPALCYGIAFAQVAQEPKASVRTGGILVITAAAVAIAVTREALIGTSWITYGIGLPFVCLAILCPTREDAFCRWLAPLTLGVYLAHPLLIGAIHRSALMPRLGLPEELTFVVAFFASVGLTYGLTKSPLKVVV